MPVMTIDDIEQFLDAEFPQRLGVGAVQISSKSGDARPVARITASHALPIKD